MALTKTQVKALKRVVSRLDVKNPQFRGADYVREALEPSLEKNAGLYVHSWVLPILKAMINDDQKLLKALLLYH